CVAVSWTRRMLRGCSGGWVAGWDRRVSCEHCGGLQASQSQDVVCGGLQIAREANELQAAKRVLRKHPPSLIQPKISSMHLAHILTGAIARLASRPSVDGRYGG